MSLPAWPVPDLGGLSPLAGIAPLPPLGGRPFKLTEADLPTIRAALDRNVTDVALARTHGVSRETIRAFRVRHGLERLLTLKAGVGQEQLTEALAAAARFLTRMRYRLARDGERWSVTDSDTLEAKLLNTVVSCLNRHDAARAKLSTLLARGFENDLLTCLVERRRDRDFLEEARRRLEQEDYAFRQNAPRRIPTNESESVVCNDALYASFEDYSRSRTVFSRHESGLTAIIAGEVRRPQRAARTLRGTRPRYCPWCGMVIPRNPVFFSSPNGLPATDSRRTPCPWCFGKGFPDAARGGFFGIQYIQVGGAENACNVRGRDAPDLGNIFIAR